MAEFQEVIKHWRRMLDAYRHGESIAIEASVPADAFKNAKLVEEIVMKWAAEHKEPVYPTWYDYLHRRDSMECCDTCKLQYEIQRWDYSHGGCEHTKPEGHVCMAFKGEGIAVWMVGNTGMCETYTPKEE